jgi:NTP pyrophosphatase (non-canonical NTP hydrolase)
MTKATWGDTGPIPGQSFGDEFDPAPASPPAEALPSQTSGAEADKIDAMFDRFLERYDSYDGGLSVDDLADLLGDVRHAVRAVVRERDHWLGEARRILKSGQAAVDEIERLRALAKPASEPAGGGVREVLEQAAQAAEGPEFWPHPKEPGDRLTYRGTKDGNWLAVKPPFKLDPYSQGRADAAAAVRALSSPASSSPAEAEALQAGVDDLAGRLKFEAEHWSSSTFEDVQDGAKLMAEAAIAIEAKADDFLRRLRAANIARDAEYRAKTQGEPLPLLFRTTEFAGEVGELLNVVKKIERERLGWAGKRADRKMLLEEFGGVVATLDLLAMMLGVDLAAATADEFNAVSDRLALSTKLGVLSSAPAQEDGSKELSAHPLVSGQNASGGGA